MRSAGILLPISSLPSKFGIGCFSKEAYEFVDFLKKAGQTYWQILPLGPTGYGDSPYQSFSTYAGNPFFIDLETLAVEGLLEISEIENFDFGNNPTDIDYEKIWLSRFKVLRTAFERSNIESSAKYAKFLKKNSFWLDDYALYMAVKNAFGGKSFSEWDDDIRFRKKKAITRYKKILRNEIDFYRFIQYKFFEQWNKLKKYANKNGIKIIGDIPIYVAFDSSDTWSQPELFKFDKSLLPTGVAGCPPDAFSKTGQLWGNPLYDWECHKKTHYEWWVKRIRHCLRLYDVVRIDHFRGFDEYYSIPYGDKTAENGKWEKGPGSGLFKALNKALGDMDIIAEDLGFLTESVYKLVKDTGFPGMKILQFAFDSRESGDYLPHNYTKNSVVYTGTHDNNTLKGWYNEMTSEDRNNAIQYMNDAGCDADKFCYDMIRLAMASVSEKCIIPMQDYLCLDKEARINVPSMLGSNWRWRMSDDVLTKKLRKAIYNITKTYGRCV